MPKRQKKRQLKQIKELTEDARKIRDESLARHAPGFQPSAEELAGQADGPKIEDSDTVVVTVTSGINAAGRVVEVISNPRPGETCPTCNRKVPKRRG